MARLAIYPHAASDTINAMIPVLREMIEPRDRIVRMVSTRNSAFRGREGDVIFNYGRGNILDQVVGGARVINPASAVSNASSKVNAFTLMAGAGVSTVEWTTDRSVADTWHSGGSVVYARTMTRGHSGEGIIVCYRNTSELDVLGSSITASQGMVTAPLYTKGITGPRREFRIHVMNGNIVFTQQKRRRDGFAEMPEASNIVRNYHTGWIYATQNVNANDAAQTNAIAAVRALGLDYGAVDVITNGQNAWVLEVNTAPGMTGSNLNNFCRCLVDNFYGREFTAEVGETVEEEAIMPAAPGRPSAAPTTPSPEVAAAPHQWRRGDRFRVTNYEQPNSGYVITDRHRAILRAGSILTVDSISNQGRIGAANLWFNTGWIEYVQPLQPQGGTDDFQLGDVVIVTNLDRSHYESSVGIHSDMTQIMNNREEIKITRERGSSRSYQAGRYSYLPESLQLVRRATPVIHPTPLRPGDAVKIDNLISPSGQTFQSINPSDVSATHVRTVQAVNPTTGVVTVSGISDGFLPSMLSVHRYCFTPGDTVIVTNTDTPPGRRTTPVTSEVSQLMSSQTRCLVESVSGSGTVVLNNGSLVSPNWLQRVTGAVVRPRELLTFSEGDVVIVDNLDRNPTDQVQHYPTINGTMRENLRTRRIMRVRRYSGNGESVILDDGFYYNPHWIVYASDEVREEAARVAREAAEAAEEARVARDAALAAANEVVVEVPENGSICKITLKAGGLNTVGLYSSARSSFDVVGFEVPVAIGEINRCVVVGAI